MTPGAIRGFYDKKKLRFVIQFKYIDDEPKEDRVFDSYVKLRVGRNSERLYAIEIDVDTLRANQVQFLMAVQREVDGAFTELLTRSPSRRLENYQLAKEALATRQQELFAAIA